MKKDNGIVKNALILFAIAVVLSAVLGIVNQLTKDRIAEQAAKEKADAYAAVYAGATFEEDAALTEAVAASPELMASIGNVTKIEEALVAKDASGNPVGIVINMTNNQGYGGDINLSIGVDNAGTLMGMKVVSNSETAGLGANCTKPAFQEQFTGIQASEIAFSKSGKSAPNEIDAISSATFTTTACTNGVNAGLALAYSYLGLN